MAKNIDLEKALHAYRDGEKTVEETNEIIKEYGLHIDPMKNVITADEMDATTVSGDLKTINGYVYVDTGTGSLNKVQVIDSVLQGFDAGVMRALAIVGRMYWEIDRDRIGKFMGILPEQD